MHGGFELLVNLSVSLVLALVLGLITQRLRLSPIVGYLLAGVALGPQTPGFVANAEMAVALAEIGVVLLMFGVGLHFDLKDLLAVRRIALPGAVGQIAVAAILGVLVAVVFGYGIVAGVMIGVAVSVASTVVLVRVLTDNEVLETSYGHIAVGWLIVEDIFTVLVLVVLPGFAVGADHPEGAVLNVPMALAWAMVKTCVLAALVLVVGRRAIPWLLRQVARTRSRELFTLAVLALALAVATGSAAYFGVSVALGAFLAGMVVGQSEVSQQAASDALPMRDAFAVLFFVSVGMLFDPKIIVDHPGLLLSLLGVVLIAKPLTAMAIVWGLRYSVRAALTVAVGLAQIGEFSFLLADEATSAGLLQPEGRSLLVACAIVSITVNPILFRSIVPFERWLATKEQFWKFATGRSVAKAAQLNVQLKETLAQTGSDEENKPIAVVVGYGPVGQTACRVLRDFEVRTVVVDLNLDTVRNLMAADQPAIYGDATRRDILEAAGILRAKYLLITIPDVMTRSVVILAAKSLNEDLRVFARARYIQERAWLEEVGATEICTEEAEIALGLAMMLLREVGADEDRMRQEVDKIQRELGSRGADAARL